MPFVRIAATVMAVQIEDFPKEAKRSCSGSLHIRPGSAELTADELEHIQTTRPELFEQMHVSGTDEQLEASRKALTEPAPEPTPPPDASPAADVPEVILTPAPDPEQPPAVIPVTDVQESSDDAPRLSKKPGKR